MNKVEEISFIKLLEDIAIASNESQTFEEAAQKSIDKVCDSIGWELGHLYYILPGNIIENSKIWHLSDPKRFKVFQSITENYSFEFGEGLPGSVLEHKKPLWIEDVINYSNFPRSQFAREVGLITGFGFPVILNNTTEAIIEFFSTEKIEPDKNFFELIGLLGTQLGAVLKRTRFEEKSKINEQQLSSIFNNVEDVIFLISIEDGRYKFISINKAYTEVTGLESEHVVNKFLDEIMVEPMLSTSIKNIEKALETKSTVKWEESNLYPKGKITGEVSLTPLFDEKGDCNKLIGIVHDITFWKKANEEIKKLNEELEVRVKTRTAQLENANKELESFVYSVSHDLRAPLRSVIGFSELLESEHKKSIPPAAVELLNFIVSNAQKMNQIIDDLLAYSRITRNELVKSEIDMKTLIQQVIKELQASAEYKAKFEIKDILNSQGDIRLIHEVWTNLISNALKYSSKQENPVIEIGSFEDDMEFIYYVKDNGVGFDMKFYNKLFEMFQRFHSDSDFVGTGIGLAIVKKIITRHGGRVWANAEIGAGATFYFSIPKQYPTAPKEDKDLD
jgi:PAS domain S-box-containing protein